VKGGATTTVAGGTGAPSFVPVITQAHLSLYRSQPLPGAWLLALRAAATRGAGAVGPVKGELGDHRHDEGAPVPPATGRGWRRPSRFLLPPPQPPECWCSKTERQGQEASPIRFMMSSRHG